MNIHRMCNINGFRAKYLNPAILIKIKNARIMIPNIAMEVYILLAVLDPAVFIFQLPYSTNWFNLLTTSFSNYYSE
jgi:hypothetical protein